MQLALFITGTLAPSLRATHGDLAVVYNRYFADPHGITLDNYDVVSLQYPSDGDLDKYDAIVITGSAASAYEDVEWINKLVSYIAQVIDTKPSIKIIGICFGHQIVARAMGAQVIRNDRWEVGSTLVNLTATGKAIFGVDSFRIQEIHRDHVPSIPAGFHLLGSTDVSLNQGMVRFYRDKAYGKPNDVHIFTIQGHPEFTESIVSGILEVRGASGAIDQETVADGLNKRHMPDDGRGVIRRTIWRVLGVNEGVFGAS